MQLLGFLWSFWDLFKAPRIVFVATVAAAVSIFLVFQNDIDYAAWIYATILAGGFLGLAVKAVTKGAPNVGLYLFVAGTAVMLCAIAGTSATTYKDAAVESLLGLGGGFTVTLIAAYLEQVSVHGEGGPKTTPTGMLDP